MKLLLDENLPQELRPLLSKLNAVFTVAYSGGSGTSNGELLRRAADDGFDALLTVDRGYEHQRDLNLLRCAVLLLVAKRTQIEDLRPQVGKIVNALAQLAPRTIVREEL